MNIRGLIAALNDVPPADLQTMQILRDPKNQPPPGGWFPVGVSIDVINDALSEMLEYQEACQKLLHALRTAPPMPVELSIPEYGL